MTAGAVPEARGASLKAAAVATLASRFAVWWAAVVATARFGTIPVGAGLRVPGVPANLDWLASPVARWDARWFALIAQGGYAGTGSDVAARSAFFPLYPLLLHAAGAAGVPLVIAGALISTISLGAGLYLVHRLVRLEVAASAAGAQVMAADLAVLLLAFSPMAVFFSAMYSDSLYLALSVGAFLSARRGRWLAAGGLGGLAAATRPVGVLLVVPMALLYLYGPGTEAAARRAGRARWIPRRRVRPDVAWLLLVPAGLAAFSAYLAWTGAGALAPLRASAHWNHHFVPLAGLWQGVVAAAANARGLASGTIPLAPFATGIRYLVDTGLQNLAPLALLAVAVPAIIGVARTLPAAYTAYVVVALALPLSLPVTGYPLQSVPRYEAVLFPLFMWAGPWLARHPRWQAPVLGGSALLAMFFAAEFATWHFVA